VEFDWSQEIRRIEINTDYPEFLQHRYQPGAQISANAGN